MIIHVKHIAAAIHTAAVSDVRLYLNAVYVEGRIVVSTDGYVLSAYRGPESAEYLPPFLIPLDAAKLIAKLKPINVEVSALPDGRIDVGGVVFKPVEGVFPYWRRVVRPAEPGPRTAQLNPELVAKFIKVAKALGHKPHEIALWNPSGDPMAARLAIRGCEDEFIGVIMGVRYGVKDPIPVCGEWQ